jgi:transcriptional regulator with XRE-family HTH domain
MAQLNPAEYSRQVAEEHLFRDAHNVLQEGLAQSGLTQKAVATRLEVSEGRMSQIFSGSENLTLRSFAAVGWALGITLAIRMSGAVSSPGAGGVGAAHIDQLHQLNRDSMPAPRLPVIRRPFAPTDSGETNNSLAA